MAVLRVQPIIQRKRLSVPGVRKTYQTRKGNHKSYTYAHFNKRLTVPAPELGNEHEHRGGVRVLPPLQNILLGVAASNDNLYYLHDQPMYNHLHSWPCPKE